jgi:homoserine/homoserine lactone efflux protein
LKAELLVGFAGLIFVATSSPGPNVLSVISSAVLHGVRGAAFAIAGNLIALAALATAAALGVGALMTAWPEAYRSLRLAGAGYLIFVGVKALKSSFGNFTIEPDQTQPDPASVSSGSIMLRSMFISLSNPKAVLFFSAVLPNFLDASAPIGPQLGMMLAAIVAVVCIVHSIYAVLALTMRSRLVSEGGKRWTARLSGLCFVGLGLGLVFETLRTW